MVESSGPNPRVSAFSHLLVFLTIIFCATAAPSSLRINVGGKTISASGEKWNADTAEQLFGVTSTFEVAKGTEIALTESDNLYRTQRFGTERDSGDPIWGYNLRVEPGVYSLTLHFAEIYDGVFLRDEGPRVFHTTVGDNERGVQSVERNLDIYSALQKQENTALTKTFSNLIVAQTLQIRFFPVSMTPVLNAISAERTGPLPKHVFRLQVNVGGEDTISAFVRDQPKWLASPDSDTTEIQDGDIRYKLLSDVDGALHLKQRFSFGKRLIYDIPVPKNSSLDVILLFAENYVNGIGKRVFDIIVGDKDGDNESDDVEKEHHIRGYDIFKEAGSMYTPVRRSFSDVKAPSGVLRIQLEAVVENPILSAFVVKRPGQNVFVSTSNPVFNSEAGGYSHQSHAVAGKDILVVDFDRDGFAVAQLDASLSHSHFFEPGPPSVAGRIINSTWVLHDTNQVIGMSPKISVPFPVGNTVVRLEVTDNVGGTHSDSLTVVALDREVPGIYAYFYDSRVVYTDLMPNSGDFSTDSVLPQVGRHINSLNFQELKDYHWFSFMDLPFQARYICHVSVSVAQSFQFYVEHLSPVRIYVDRKLVPLVQKGNSASIGTVFLSSSKHVVEILFRRSDSSAASSLLKVLYYPRKSTSDACVLGNKCATYDAAKIQPTIHTVMPKACQLNGGGRIRVYGSGFVVTEPNNFGLVLRIRNSSDVLAAVPLSTKGDNGGAFSGIRADSILRGNGLGDVSSWSMEFTAPKHDRNESLHVSVETGAGVSNKVPIVYDENAVQPIRFRESRIVEKDGSAFEVARPTCVALGPDLKLYIGTMEGFVIRLTIDHFSLKVKHKCQSSAPGPNRVVLGIAFNPYDTDPDDVRFYVSTSTLFWKTRDLGKTGWANGKVQLMKKDVGGFCLGVVEDVVTGLPVSNYDHGVNGLTFDKKGNLLIAIGSSTNAGVSTHGDALGGVPDSPLSAAVVVARVSKDNFNGTVTYNQYDNPATAYQISGDVDVFSSGVRNTFDMVIHSSDKIYATSNSPNYGFGRVSTSCTEDGEERRDGYSDQIVRLEEDSYHGHPNRNRGRFDKRQCVFYSVETHPEGAEGVFEKPLAVVESSTDGIIEYTANTFDFALRGDLFASKFAVGTAGMLYRMKMNATSGAPEFNKPEVFHDASGLSLTMLPTGAMAMPQIVQGQVLVLEPEEVVPNGPYMTSIFPNRGPLGGGYRVSITGYNLGRIRDLKVLFDGVRAEDIKMEGSRGQQVIVSAKVPGGDEVGRITVQVRRRDGRQSPSIGNDFEYLGEG